MGSVGAVGSAVMVVGCSGVGCGLRVRDRIRRANADGRVVRGVRVVADGWGFVLRAPKNTVKHGACKASYKVSQSTKRDVIHGQFSS